MTAGMNIRINIYNIQTTTDDVIGGADPVEFLMYKNLRARLEELKPNTLLLQQGIEITNTYTCLVDEPTLNIYERDEVEITFPKNHHFYGKRMRITGVQYSSMHPSDRRSYVILYLSKKTEAHANDYNS